MLKFSSFRVNLIGHFKQHFEHFKLINIHFHPQVYQKHPNNITQIPLPNTPLLACVFEFLEGKNEKEKKKA